MFALLRKEKWTILWTTKDLSCLKIWYQFLTLLDDISTHHRLALFEKNLNNFFGPKKGQKNYAWKFEIMLN